MTSEARVVCGHDTVPSYIFKLLCLILSTCILDKVILICIYLQCYAQQGWVLLACGGEACGCLCYNNYVNFNNNYYDNNINNNNTNNKYNNDFGPLTLPQP